MIYTILSIALIIAMFIGTKKADTFNRFQRRSEASIRGWKNRKRPSPIVKTAQSCQCIGDAYICKACFPKLKSIWR